MTKQELLAILGIRVDGEASLAEMLIRTTFDELMEIDLQSRQYRVLYHEDDKYIGIMMEGDYDRLYEYAAEHYVHPENRQLFRDMMNPVSMTDRLRSAAIPGAIAGNIRRLGTNGEWIRTRYLLIYGPEIGQADHIVHCYIYDIEGQWQRRYDTPKTEEQEIFSGQGEAVTGLLNGLDYFRPMQKILPTLGKEWCVVDIFLEHFKIFTGWYGMESARYLLAETGDLMQSFAKEAGGYPGYIGQEEFCITIPFDMDRIRELYHQIEALIGKVSMIEGFSPIFGVAMIDGSCSEFIEYFNHAAMMRMESEKNREVRIRLYDPEEQKIRMQEYEILYQFREALKKGEITFWLQPQVRVSNSRIVGAEALARWKMPDGTMLSPGKFIPILEKYGLVSMLDQYIWEAVCQWLHDMEKRGRAKVPISVNLSQIDLTSIDVPAVLEELLKKYDLSPEDLDIEITESACANEFEKVEENLTRLHEMGFQVLMDDFGSGYSSLNMLRSLNVDVIKLDAQFLRIDERERRKGINILESVVDLTKTLSVPAIVEGVETEQQARFLREQGCPYMQGYYFYRPMPAQEFEALLYGHAEIDEKGFVFKANQEIRSRELLDESIYSDTMLNNILGPVVFYRLHDKDIDIIRYNEQFYELVNIDLEEFENRRTRIQAYIYPEDKAHFYRMFEEAERNYLVGSTGIVRTYRPNGVLVWISLKIFYIGADAKGKRFYASAQDVSELQAINLDIPGGYYRCRLEDDFEFLYISRNFESMTGYTSEEIRELFDNRLSNMVHPDDLPVLQSQAGDILAGELDVFQPYRLRRKKGDYIYVAEQSYLTDRYGSLCWQSMLIDVTNVMQIRNQMTIIADYMKNTILFLHRRPEGLIYEVAVNGLEEHMRMSRERLEESLNSGEFCTWIDGHRQIPHREYTALFIESILNHPRIITVRMPHGAVLPLDVRADYVKAKTTTVDYIVIMSLHEESL